MENHPIPQDITGFKFTLIGSMTVKQFAYIAGCSVMAYLILILPVFIVFKLPFLLFFIGLGLFLAFIPVDGRPADTMILNYIRALPSENQYVYKKVGIDLPDFVIKASSLVNQTTPVRKEENQEKIKKALFFSQLRNAALTDQKEVDFLKKIGSFFEEQVIKATPAPQAPIQQPPPQPVNIATADITRDQVIRQEVAAISQELKEVKEDEEKGGKSADVENKIKDLEQRLEKALIDKELLEKRLFQVARQQQTETLYKPGVKKEVAESPRVKTVTPSASVNAGFPILPDLPNIILGIVKDPRGRVIPNVLVEVLDKNDIPVRAFKTNSVGQFIAATPVSNGTYKIIFDDPAKKNDFDTIEVALNGQIFHPLEITSVDQRERLRRDLFHEVN